MKPLRLFVVGAVLGATIIAAGTVVEPVAKTHAADAQPGDYVVTFEEGTNVAAKVRTERSLGNPVGKVFSDAVDGFVAKLDASDVRRLRQDGDVVSIEPNSTIRVAADTNRYIVRVKSNVNPAALAASVGGSGIVTYSNVFSGFTAALSDAARDELAADSNVIAIEPDLVVAASADQTNSTWGLDRSDQRSLPLNSRFATSTDGRGVRAYVVDTGIRATHTEFAGRVVSGFDGILDGNGTDDCHGHGTHVAGTVGGTRYGIAKAVTLVPVRVLGCTGSGYMSVVIQGLDWIVADHAVGVPAVANVSLGGAKSSLMNQAVARTVADGVTVVVAAGNANADACNSSPSSETTAITVGASTSTDARATFSNWGSCLDVFAPGASITSATATSDVATATLSGTSMAAPHVTGAAALLLESQPNSSPAQVATRINDSATVGVLSGVGAGSPNALLFVGSDPTVAPTTTAASPTTSQPSSSAPTTVVATTAPPTTQPLVPPNDAFASATRLGTASGAIEASTIGATRESGEPTHGGWGGAASIWFSWIAPADGDLVVSTGTTSGASLSSTFDTLLGVYSGARVDMLTSLQTNDDFSWPTYSWSRISMSVTAGTEYRIAVDGYAGSSGSVKLSWNFAAVDLTVRPSEPRSVVATPADSGAYVGWEVPLTVGRGTLIYTATVSPGGQSCTTASTRCLVGGLINGTEYSVVVNAKNNAGEGPNSNPPVAFTPNTPWGRAISTRAWGVDRLDQRALPLSGTISRPTSGRLVNVYVIDTGVYAAHDELALRIAQGRNTIEGALNPADTNDCNGHGTHVAGTIAGRTLGVAPDATVIPVKVLDCFGSGTLAGVVAGIDWMVANHESGVPAVANLSLGGGVSPTLNAAIARAVADGITVVVAAGNSNDDACNYSPASEPSAITVGASDRTDLRSSFSNWGACVDVFAPGSQILSAAISGPNAEATLSGTSMASPHVAGAAALVLDAFPLLTPAEVAQRITASATRGVVLDPGPGSPNKLLFIGVNDNPPATSSTIAPETTAPATTTSTSTTVDAPRRDDAVPTTLADPDTTTSPSVVEAPSSTLASLRATSITLGPVLTSEALVSRVSPNKVIIRIKKFKGSVDVFTNEKFLFRTSKRAFVIRARGIGVRPITVRASTTRTGP